MTRRTIAGLNWGAKRMGGTATLYLRIYILKSFEHASTKTKKALAGALDSAQLENLRFLSAHCCSAKQDDSAVVENVGAQLLKKASGVEKMKFTRGLCLDSMSYQHLRHLEVRVRSIDGAVQAPTALPALETLCLISMAEDSLDKMDLSACQHLRSLALIDLEVGQLLMPPACRLSCGFDAMGCKLIEDSVSGMSAVFGLVDQLGVRLRALPCRVLQAFLSSASKSEGSEDLSTGSRISVFRKP